MNDLTSFASGSGQSGLPPSVVQSMHARLLDQAQEWQARIDEQKKRLSDKDPEVGDAKGNTFVAGSEGGRAAEADDDAVAILHHARGQLQATLAALQRIQDGQFGICAACDEPIGQQRLEVVPYARLCRDCQSDAEAHRGH